MILVTNVSSLSPPLRHSTNNTNMYVRQIDIPTIRLGSTNGTMCMRQNEHIKYEVCRRSLCRLCIDSADQSGGSRLLSLFSGYPRRCVSSCGQYRCGHVLTFMSKVSQFMLLGFHFVHARPLLQLLVTWIVRSLTRNNECFMKQTVCAISWTIKDVLIQRNKNSDGAVMKASQLKYRICLFVCTC